MRKKQKIAAIKKTEKTRKPTGLSVRTQIKVGWFGEELWNKMTGTSPGGNGS